MVLAVPSAFAYLVFPWPPLVAVASTATGGGVMEAIPTPGSGVDVAGEEVKGSVAGLPHVVESLHQSLRIRSSYCHCYRFLPCYIAVHNDSGIIL